PAPPHAVRRNPPVRIDDWPELGSDHKSEAEVVDEAPADGPDQDPPYEEPNPGAGRAELDLLNEYEMGDAELQAAYDRRLVTWLIRNGWSCTWDEPLGIPSEFIAWRRLRILAGLEIREYDCCVNLCVCFLGKHADRELQALFRNRDMVDKLGYQARSEVDYDPGVYRNIFDGKSYRTLRNTQLDPNHEYCFFDNPEDLLIDMNSYLAPVLDELLLLERGVESIKAPPAGARNDVGV
ncbi:hypothetical protein FRC06_010305, partial [Ceratobasidium sp. 370]